MFELKRSYNIKEEGICNFYIAFCSADEDLAPNSNDNQGRLRILDGYLTFSNSSIGYLSGELFMKLKVLIYKLCANRCDVVLQWFGPPVAVLRQLLGLLSF